MLPPTPPQLSSPPQDPSPRAFPPAISWDLNLPLNSINYNNCSFNLTLDARYKVRPLLCFEPMPQVVEIPFTAETVHAARHSYRLSVQLDADVKSAAVSKVSLHAPRVSDYISYSCRRPRLLVESKTCWPLGYLHRMHARLVCCLHDTQIRCLNGL